MESNISLSEEEEEEEQKIILTLFLRSIPVPFHFVKILTNRINTTLHIKNII